MPLKRPDPSERAHKKKPQVQPKQVGSQFGLVDPAHPFAGLGEGTGAPAREKGKNLTELTAQARARRQRLTPGTGGLLTKPVLTAEKKAATVVPTKTRFATPPKETKAPPKKPAADLGIGAPFAGRSTALAGALEALAPTPTRQAAGRNIIHGGTEGGIGLGGIKDYLAGPAIGKPAANWLGKNVLGPAYVAADKGWGTGASETLKAVGIGGQSTPSILWDDIRGKPHVELPKKWQSAAEVGGEIANIGLKRPNVSVPKGWLHFEGNAYAGVPGNAKIPFDQIEGGYSLTTEGKKNLLPMMKANGYSSAEIDGKSAEDWFYMAYNKAPPLWQRLAKNFAGDAVAGGSLVVGTLGLASEAAQGRGAEAAKGYGKALASIAPVVGPHPFGDEITAHPLFAATALHGGLKSVGALGHLRPGAAKERSFPLATDPTGAPVNRGDYSKNLITGAGQQVSDLAARHSKSAARRVERKDVDLSVRRAKELTSHEHAKFSHPYIDASARIHSKHEETLLAIVDHGGAPGLEDAILHFQKKAGEGAPAAKQRLAMLHDALDTVREGLDANDKAWVDAHGALSGHTTHVYSRPGSEVPQFGEEAAAYRKAETPIVMASERGDPLAMEIEALHKQWNAGQSSGWKNEPTPAFKAKTSEVGRDVKRHDKKAVPTREEWQAKGKDIEKRKPKLRDGASEAQKTKHKEDMRLWRNEKSRHTRQGGRISAHETEVRQQGKRLDKLNATQRAKEAARGDREGVSAALLSALDEFNAQHMARPGALEPHRVARTPLQKPGVTARVVSGVIPKTKHKRQHATTGSTVRSGEYQYDAGMPLRENHEAMMRRTDIGLYNALRNHPSTRELVGEPEHGAIVPEGMVAVPIDNLRGAHKTVADWTEDTTLSTHDHFGRSDSLRKRFVDSLLPKLEGEKINPGEHVLLVPKGRHERIEEWAKPNSADTEITRWDNINKGYQKLLVGLYPSTWVGNAPGSLVSLTLPSGAYHPMDFYRGVKMTKPGGRTMEYPHSILGVGAGASLGRKSASRNPVMATAERGRSFSRYGEDFAAKVAWAGRARPDIDGRLPTLRHILPALDKVMPDSLKGEAARMSVDSASLWRAFATGKYDDGAPLSPRHQKMVDRIADHVHSFMSEEMKPQGKLGRRIGKVVMFQNWLGHILKLTMVTLPLHHPRRATLMNAMALYGDEYRQEHGVFPSWMKQFFPLPGFLGGEQARKLAGETVPGALSLSMGQLTALSSASNLWNAGTGNGGPQSSLLRQIANQTNPAIKTALTALMDQNDNSQLKPYERHKDVWGNAKANIFYSAPGARKYGVTNGYTSASANFMGVPIPGIGMTKKEYAAYLLNPSKRSYKKVPIPWEWRGGGQPIEGWKGDLLRTIGFSPYWNATGGTPLAVENNNLNTFAITNAIGEALAKAKAKQAKAAK